MFYMVFAVFFYIGLVIAGGALTMAWASRYTDRVWHEKWWKPLLGITVIGLTMSGASYGAVYYYVLKAFADITL